MKVSHEEYLKRTLKSKKLELENEKVLHRIAIEKHNLKQEMLQSQIDSIEHQLEDAKS